VVHLSLYSSAEQFYSEHQFCVIVMVIYCDTA
jgi:hypothetical protein